MLMLVKSFHSKWGNILNAMALFVAGIVFISFGVYASIDHWQFLRSSSESRGLVVDLEKECRLNTGGRGQKCLFTPHVEFVTSSGRFVAFKSKTATSGKSLPRIGEYVVVRYVVSKDTQHVNAEIEGYEMNAGIFLIIFGAVFLIVGVVLFWIFSSSPRLNQPSRHTRHSSLGKLL